MCDNEFAKPMDGPVSWIKESIDLDDGERPCDVERRC